MCHNKKVTLNLPDFNLDNKILGGLLQKIFKNNLLRFKITVPTLISKKKIAELKNKITMLFMYSKV